jgi:hypothetical protein
MLFVLNRETKEQRRKQEIEEQDTQDTTQQTCGSKRQRNIAEFMKAKDIIFDT